MSREGHSEMPGDPVGLCQPVSYSSSGRLVGHAGSPVVVFTDSSTTGCGAHCLDEVVSRGWSSQEACLHINNLEVYKALLHWEGFVSNKVVLVVTDNSTGLSCYINKQGGGDEVSFVGQDSHRDVCVLLQMWGRDPGQTHRWEAECAGRFFVAKGQTLHTE